MPMLCVWHWSGTLLGVVTLRSMSPSSTAIVCSHSLIVPSNLTEGIGRFCNKIYQATKYALKYVGGLTPRSTVRKSGKESLPERWILHKLSISAKRINDHLEKREFSLSTQVAYKYFYEFLCDTYIENSKAIFEEGSEEEKESAKQTLYTAIEGGLLMIHPFMPFLTVS